MTAKFSLGTNSAGHSPHVGGGDAIADTDRLVGTSFAPGALWVIEDLWFPGNQALGRVPRLHLVTPVMRGVRVASFFWLQSMIGVGYARSLIFDLDTLIQAPMERLGRDDPETVKLTGIYYNLIRYWAKV